MLNHSVTWVSLHRQLSYAKKNRSTAEEKVYTVTRSNFHLLKAKQLGQGFRTWILCKLTCEEV